MKSERISIVIPMYNAEAYIEACLRSVKNQSYSDFECLVIDDGSTDESLDKAIRFSQTDSRFKVIKQTHKGVSYAVSNGIRNASGAWLYFLDSDDWIDDDELQLLYQLVTENACDLIASDYVIETERSTVKSIVRYAGVVEKADFPALFYSQMLCNERYSGIVCGNSRGGKLVRRSLAVKNMSLQEGLEFAEDAILMLGVLLDCERVYGYPGHAGYHYRKHQASSMHNYGTSYAVHRTKYAQTIKTLYASKGIEGDDRLEKNYWRFNLYNVLGSLQSIEFDMRMLENKHPEIFVWINETAKKLTLLDKKVLGKRNILLLWLLEHRMYWLLSMLYRINRFLR